MIWKFQKKIISFLVFGSFMIILNTDINAQKAENLPCYDWIIYPVLYNNYVSDTTVVEYWENYWYYRTGDNRKLIPDTLIIGYNFVPSLEILPEQDIDNMKYFLKSTVNFKYGLHDRSYNVINPHLSDTIVVLNQIIETGKIYDEIIHSDNLSKSFFSKKIPIKDILDTLNIYYEEGIWNYDKKGKPFSLNQVIINIYFINMNGEVKCLSEFTFPINGAYNNSLGGKWQY